MILNKKKTIVMALFVTSMVSMIVFSNVSAQVAVSDVGDGLDSVWEARAREPWWNSLWHHRMYIKIDPNDYDRRWGRPIEYDLGLSDLTDLDVNSIRVVYNGTEIPSEYDAETGIVLFVMGETLLKEDVQYYAIYYDTISNGVKPIPDYGTMWFVDTYENTVEEIDQYNEDYDSAFASYLDEYQIKDISGAHVLRGETVVQGVDGEWYYLNGTRANHYVIGDGVFYWYDGYKIFADDQGNWYLSYPTVVSGETYLSNVSLLFNDGEYVYEVPAGGIYRFYSVDGTYILSITSEAGEIVLLEIDTINDYYMTLIPSLIDEEGTIPGIYATIVYRDPITGIWYLINNSIVEGFLDYDGRDAYIYGHRIYQDLVSGDWYYKDDEGNVVLFASETTDVYMYQDQMIYQDVDGKWKYYNGTEVVGYVYEEDDTWYLYVGDTLEGMYVEDTMLKYHDEYIEYDELTNTWYYYDGTEFVGEFSETDEILRYGDDLIYYDDVEGKWYYVVNDTEVIGYIYMDDSSGEEIYYFQNDGVLRYFYITNDIIYYWNGTEYHYYGPYDYKGETIYIDSVFDCVFPSSIEIVDTDDGPSDFGPVKAMTGWVITVDVDDDVFTENVQATLYDGVPDYELSLDSEHGPFASCWGSLTINLNGTVRFGDLYFDKDNISDYIDDLESDFNSWGIDIGQDLDDFSTGTIDSQQLLDSANGYAIITEFANIIPSEIDFDADGYLFGDSSFKIYDTGNDYAVGEKLQVVPFLLNSRYFGVYDILAGVGYGLSSNDGMLWSNILIEVWKETLLDRVNYYVNISFNYADWWYTSIGSPSGSLDGVHVYQPITFDAKAVYLNDIDPHTIFLDSIGAIPDVIVTTVDSEDAVPVEVGRIIAPMKVGVDQEFPIIAFVKGETIGAIKYRIGSDPTELDFDEIVPQEIINVPIAHIGRRATVNRTLSMLGTVIITVIAYDTNGESHTNQCVIQVSVNANETFIWLAWTLAGVFSVLGIAMVKNKSIIKKDRIPDVA